MDQLTAKLKKMQEYSTLTAGGYSLTNFHLSNAYDGQRTLRLHFKRKGSIQPTAFDISIQYLGNYIVNYKDRSQDLQQLNFPDYESVIAYLTAK
ncbi:hypothetical protein LX87_04644 [Larkinella arboricola]|uniref:Uncharacterized protein n=1 Tax=Larkinella arboricola TaxID=643671 RepID=A0A327WQL0_LARAB|nr:hypothetical protein [Larkinella arboricola]RAJ93132.1 hypothetical protein LX87_04644 [Larkinella arboricola]